MDLGDIIGNEEITEENSKEMFQKIFAEYKRCVKTMPKYKIKYSFCNIRVRCLGACFPVSLLILTKFTISTPYATAVVIGVILYLVLYRMIHTHFEGKPYGKITAFLFFTSIMIAGEIAVFSLYKVNPLIPAFLESHFIMVIGTFAAALFVILGPNKERIEELVCAKMFLKEIRKQAVKQKIEEEEK